MAPHTEHLFVGIMVKFRRAHFGVWRCRKNLARELRGRRFLAETGLRSADRMELRACAQRFCPIARRFPWHRRHLHPRKAHIEIRRRHCPAFLILRAPSRFARSAKKSARPKIFESPSPSLGQRDGSRNHRHAHDEKRLDFTPRPVARRRAALLCVLTPCIDWLFSLNPPPPANPCILQGFELVGPARFELATS